jgi:hypothetical protein
MCLNIHAVASHIGGNVYFINNKRTLPCLKSSGKGHHVQTISPSAGAAMLRIRDGREREILCRQVKFSVFCNVEARLPNTCGAATCATGLWEGREGSQGGFGCAGQANLCLLAHGGVNSRNYEGKVRHGANCASGQ